jgi:hypothetical protein
MRMLAEPRRRRLAAGLHYFHVACRFARTAAGPVLGGQVTIACALRSDRPKPRRIIGFGIVGPKHARFRSIQRATRLMFIQEGGVGTNTIDFGSDGRRVIVSPLFKISVFRHRRNCDPGPPADFVTGQHEAIDRGEACDSRFPAPRRDLRQRDRGNWVSRPRNVNEKALGRSRRGACF